MNIDNNFIRSAAFGTEYTQETDKGFVFSRFTEQERSVLSYGKDNSHSTAGIRLEFESDSESLTIAVSAKSTNPHERNFYSFDVYCDNNMIGQIKNFDTPPIYPYGAYSLDDAQKTFILPRGLKRIRIYFPWSVQGIIRKIEIDDNAVLKPISKTEKIIMYGDSITQGYDSECPSHSYASQFADFRNANAINKGIGGCVFMPELTSVKSDFTPNLITVACGTNDWNISEFSSFQNRCHSFFENLLKNYPNIPIVALSPVWRADSDEIRTFGDFSKVAETLKDFSQKYKNVHFINGTDFIPKDIKNYRDSYLHPNDKGFEFYINSLKSAFENIEI